LLIKVLLLDCEVEDASTKFFIRERMTQLTDKIKELNSNILAFNKSRNSNLSLDKGGGQEDQGAQQQHPCFQQVQELHLKPRQVEEESSDLFMYVLHVYLSRKDCNFVQDVTKQKN
jgi:hypothetical protein